MANINQYPSQAIKIAKDKLYTRGKRVHQKSWQSVDSPDDTWELLNHTVTFIMPINKSQLEYEVRPNQPWADTHFAERVSGVAHNPPPSAEIWPYNPSSKEFKKDEKYSHTYPERFWPNSIKEEPPMMGIRYRYGDLNDVIALLSRDPSTRQAFLPIWFPEDTGTHHRERVPCTLGYHFIIRDKFLHLNYYIRSCDIIRHFRDDIYLAVRLAHFVIHRAFMGTDLEILPGIFNMYITSLHCFANEKELLPKSNI